MICAPAGTLTLIIDWLDLLPDGMATRLEAAGRLVGETMSPTQIASILEAEVALIRSLLAA